MLINLGMPKGYVGQLREFRKSEDINGGRGAGIFTGTSPPCRPRTRTSHSVGNGTANQSCVEQQ